ncbi:MAG: hypothetical protein IIB41_07480 [Candidatus Marinimicrobia bacterium]|nr:hypothetical protein [Candidatus Neomarinimicrobiota bacterium]
MGEFKQISDILPDIMSRIGQGKERRDEFVCCCPFHEERNPSFSLNMAKGVYYCFGCGASGSLSQLAFKLGLREEGQYRHSLMNTSGKPRAIQPWQSARRIMEAFDALEDLCKESYRKERNIIEDNWNEGRISETRYYRDRQLLDYQFDSRMEIHDANRNRLVYNARRGDGERKRNLVNAN